MNYTIQLSAAELGLPKKMSASHRSELRAFNAQAIRAWQALGYEVTIDRLEGDDVPTPALDGRNVRITKAEAAA